MGMFFPYFELAASIFILLISFSTFIQFTQDRKSRFFSRFSMVAAITGFLEYSMRVAFTLDVAIYINRLSSILWALTFAMFVHFSILLTNNSEWLKKKWIYFAIYGPVAFLSFLFLFTNYMYSGHEITSIGIVNQPAKAYWLFAIQTFVYMSFGASLIMHQAIKTSHPMHKKQLMLIFVGAVASTSVGFILDQIYPLIYGVRKFWPTCVFDLAIMAFFIYAAMRRYSLFSVSAEVAAETIVETMPHSLVITDIDGKIILANQLSQKFLKEKGSELVGVEVGTLFKDKNAFKNLFEMIMRSDKKIEHFETDLINTKGEVLPSYINANKIINHLGGTIAILYVIHDVCLLKKSYN